MSTSYEIHRIGAEQGREYKIVNMNMYYLLQDCDPISCPNVVFQKPREFSGYYIEFWRITSMSFKLS
jgi:hypothetical protein